MSLSTEHVCRWCGYNQPGCTCISISELEAQLYSAVKTLLPSTDVQYNRVSVLVTYWPIGDYETTILPEIQQLETILHHRYGFEIERYPIPPTSPSPQRDLAHRVADFQKAGYHELKIIYYAGHVDNSGARPSGDGSAEGYFTIDWAQICMSVQSRQGPDVLLLLDCDCTLETEASYTDGVIELICRPNVAQNQPLTSALIRAFTRLHDQFIDRFIDIIPIGLLFSSLLELCQGCVPVHQVLKHARIARSIQLDPRCKPTQSRRLGIRPKVSPSFFRQAPEVSIEVPLKDYHRLFDNSISDGHLCGGWLDQFPAFQGYVKTDRLKIREFCHGGRWVRRVCAVVAFPAALSAYLDLRRLVVPGCRPAQYAMIPRGCSDITVPLHNGCETELHHIGESSSHPHQVRQAESPKIQLRESKLIEPLNDVLNAIVMQFLSLGMSSEDALPRCERLRIYKNLRQKVDKFLAELDPTTEQRVCISNYYCTIFGNLEERLFPESKDDSDTGSFELVGGRDESWADSSTESDGCSESDSSGSTGEISIDPIT